MLPYMPPTEPLEASSSPARAYVFSRADNANVCAIGYTAGSVAEAAKALTDGLWIEFFELELQQWLAEALVQDCCDRLIDHRLHPGIRGGPERGIFVWSPDEAAADMEWEHYKRVWFELSKLEHTEAFSEFLQNRAARGDKPGGLDFAKDFYGPPQSFTVFGAKE